MIEDRDVVIIGGGITGLSAAYHLQESQRSTGKPLSYVLLESDRRLGGKIITHQVDGFTVEGGPDCFLSQKPWAADLCGKIGLEAELMGTNDDRRKVFVLNRGRLTQLPDGVMLIIPTRIMPFVTSPLISWPGKLRMGMDLVLPKRTDPADESIASFVRRRLGNEALAKIAEPLLSGIHVSDPEEQSLLGTFPRFRDLEVKHRSLILGMLAQKRARSAHGGASKNGSGPTSPSAPRRPSSIFITLREGLGQLVAQLERTLTGHVVTGACVTEIARQTDGDGRPSYLVQTVDGKTWRSRSVVLTTPAYVSGELLQGLDAGLAAQLGSIRYVSTATVSLGYRADTFGHPLNGFGFVIPKRESRLISACTWTSTKFSHRAPDDSVLLRCFVGGPGREEMVGHSDEELISIARSELSQIMGITGVPTVARIYRWWKANPQYDLGHPDRVRDLKEACTQHPGLTIAGSAYEGVGVPDCVRQGREAANQITAYLLAN
jgi:protoporphyrinogen/coproporphyrinogen III oxidase